MSYKLFENDSKFNKMMIDMDRHLAASGVTIPYRPIEVLSQISKKFSISLPIAEPPQWLNPALASRWPTTKRVYDWYKLRYGEKIKEDYIVGRMAILIENDLWTLKFGSIYGSVSFLVSRTVKSDRCRTDGKPAVYNVVDAVEGLPQSRIGELPDNELEHIFEKYMIGVQAFGILWGSAKNDLIRLAISDIAAAVKHLTASPPEYGLSKWSSLQAAEKVLKCAIILTNSKPSKTHKLSELIKQARAAGLQGKWDELTEHIQCSPGIRYGEESCDRDAAIVAHHATLALVVMLKEDCAAFQSNISTQWTY